MGITMEAIGLLLKVLIVFFLIFIFIPSKVLKKEYDRHHYDLQDRLFSSLIHSNLMIIGFVHLLVLIGIYESISLILCLIAVIVVYKARSWGIKGNDWLIFGRKTVSKVFDWMESEGGLFKKLFDKCSELFNAFLQSLNRYLKAFLRHPLPFLLLGVILLSGMVIRFSHSVRYVYYGASDSYVHLAWTKYIGRNNLYVDGVYPLGYDALISAINKLFFIDPYVLIRFMGPVGSSLILLSVVYGAKKIKKELFIPAILGLGTYILFLNGTSSEWRQMSALPQEYAAIFLIPGMVFLNRYFKEKNKHYLFLAAETLCLTLLIHLYSAVVLAIAYIIICVFHIKDFFKLRFTTGFLTCMVFASFVGVLPMVIGLLSGIGLHEPSFQFVKDSASASGASPGSFQLFSYKEENPVLILLIVCCIALLLFSLVYAYRNKNRIGFVSALLTLFFYLQYRSEETGFPQWMDQSRTEVYLGIFAALTFLLLAAFLMSIRKKLLMVVLTVVFVTVTSVVLIRNAPFSLPRGDRYEYNEVAQAYMDIKKNYPVLNWTIVSPVEQYSESLDYGWHYQLWQYVLDATEDEKTTPEIPTEYVFWIVEKIPLNSDQPVTVEDAKKDFPVIRGNEDEYYTDAQNRRIIQAKAFYHMEEQLVENPDLSIYEDTENVRIYMLHNDQYHAYSTG